jgi:hypothetical protein
MALLATLMASFEIKEAKRKEARLRLAFCGVSGGGKTKSALRVAFGLAQAMLDAGVISGSLRRKVGVIDTERKSASLYDNVGPFDVIELEKPYTTDSYLGALRAFEAAGYPIIVIDQLSHAWAGSGGLLEKKDKLAADPYRNDWNAFADITPEQNFFIDELLASPAHLIVTMRSKTKWDTETTTDKNGRTRTKPVRIGTAPVQRPGTEYEFTTLLNLSRDGKVVMSIKDRTEIFPEGTERGRLTEEDGGKLAHWLYLGAAGDPAERPEPTAVEQGEGIVRVAIGTFATVPSLPDLAREFESAITQIRAVDTGGFNKRRWQEQLVAAKDARKAAIGVPLAAGAAPAPGSLGIAIDPEEVVALEAMLLQHGVPAEEFLTKFGVVRIMQLDPDCLEDAKAWIRAEDRKHSGAPA